MRKEEWMHQYQQMFLPEEQLTDFKGTKREHRRERCGDCTFFSEKGCNTSYIEAKYGGKNTPACSDFIPMKRS